jgi:hypothetical protein
MVSIHMPETTGPQLTYIGQDGLGYCPGCELVRPFTPGVRVCSCCKTSIQAVLFDEFHKKYLVDAEEATDDELDAYFFYMQYTSGGLQEIANWLPFGC